MKRIKILSLLILGVVLISGCSSNGADRLAKNRIALASENTMVQEPTGQGELKDSGIQLSDNFNYNNIAKEVERFASDNELITSESNLTSFVIDKETGKYNFTKTTRYKCTGDLEEILIEITGSKTTPFGISIKNKMNDLQSKMEVYTNMSRSLLENTVGETVANEVLLQPTGEIIKNIDSNTGNIIETFSEVSGNNFEILVDIQGVQKEQLELREYSISDKDSLVIQSTGLLGYKTSSKEFNKNISKMYEFIDGVPPETKVTKIKTDDTNFSTNISFGINIENKAANKLDREVTINIIRTFSEYPTIDIIKASFDMGTFETKEDAIRISTEALEKLVGTEFKVDSKYGIIGTTDKYNLSGEINLQSTGSGKFNSVVTVEKINNVMEKQTLDDIDNINKIKDKLESGQIDLKSIDEKDMGSLEKLDKKINNDTKVVNNISN